MSISHDIRLKTRCVFECSEMHRHTHWERISGESRGWKGHIQLFGLTTTPAPYSSGIVCIHILTACILLLKITLTAPRDHTTFAFTVSALLPPVWNLLLSGIHACSSSHTFCFLKTHCLEQAFSFPCRLTQVPKIRLFGFYLLTC